MSAARSKPVEPGMRAPAFTLPSQQGERVRLSELRGAPVVVYFYPKDSTPGCTLEAGEFQSLLPKFKRLKAHVLGLSPDGVDSHAKFSGKCSLGFPLLSDREHRVAEKYGVWVEKTLYGRKFWGVQRATFLIDAQGKIAKIWPRVKPRGHAADVLEAVRELA